MNARHRDIPQRPIAINPRAAIFALALIAATLTTPTIAATSANGSAAGVNASLLFTPLGGGSVPANVGPVPAGVSGTAPPGYSISNSTPSLAVPLGALGNVIASDTLTAGTQAQLFPQSSSSTSRVEDLRIRFQILSVLDALALTADAVETTVTVTCNGSVPTVTTATTLANAQVSLLGQPVITLPTSPAANSSVTIPLELPGLSIGLNQRTVGTSSASVTGITLIANNTPLVAVGAIDANISVAHAEAALVNCGSFIDSDGDGHNDNTDNCPAIANPLQGDADADNIGDACDSGDSDGDQVIDSGDNCPANVNPGQADTDNDGLGNACEDDDDNDGIHDDEDNCPLIVNHAQSDHDGDGLGDVCDSDDDNDGTPDGGDTCPWVPGTGAQVNCTGDSDGDGLLDGADNCRFVGNPGQQNQDNDQFGDACDDDRDGDGVDNGFDNCPNLANPNQLDTNNDGIGDACANDGDGDGVPDSIDNCPLVPNPLQNPVCTDDADGDGVDDADDNCPLLSNPAQIDTDDNGVGDECSNDDDGDGIFDEQDNCQLVGNTGQQDNDGDGFGNACDGDIDGDGEQDGADNCPVASNPDQLDSDGDGIGNACDGDDDGDGVGDTDDNCPLTSNANQNDADNDGIGDACEVGIFASGFETI